MARLLYETLCEKPDLFYQRSLDERQGDFATGWLSARALVLRMHSFAAQSHVAYNGVCFDEGVLGRVLGKARDQPYLIGACLASLPGIVCATPRGCCSQDRASSRWIAPSPQGAAPLIRSYPRGASRGVLGTAWTTSSACPSCRPRPHRRNARGLHLPAAARRNARRKDQDQEGGSGFENRG